MDDNVKELLSLTFLILQIYEIIEFIYTNLNSSDMIKEMADFMENKLVGVVYAKDTPNFIANRIGVFGMMVTVNEAIKNKINIEDVDGLTGTLIGRPKVQLLEQQMLLGSMLWNLLQKLHMINV